MNHGRSRRRQGIVSRQRLNLLIKELFRKLIHVCSSFVPLLLGLNYWLTISLLVFALIFYVVSEIIRGKGYNVPVVSLITQVAARKRDENKFVLGPVTLVVGILGCSLLFRNPVCYSVGIFALAFGDGLASLNGKLFGRVEIPFTQGKTVAGSLTCFAAIFLSSFLVCRSASSALIFASVGMFIELLPLKDLDNVIIPILLGGICRVIL